jgi:hypothetical protein
VLLKSGVGVYLVIVYSSTAGGATGGDVQVKVTGADSFVLADDPADPPNGDIYDGNLANAMKFVWKTKETDGFIVAVTPGNVVCYEHGAVDRVEAINFVQGNGSGSIPLAVGLAEVANSRICIKVPP